MFAALSKTNPFSKFIYSALTVSISLPISANSAPKTGTLDAFVPGQLGQAEDYRASIDSIIAMAAKRSPHAAAFTWPKGSVTFAQFDQAVSARAADLTAWFEEHASRSIKGERLGVFCKKEPGAILLIMAALRAGAVAVPLNPALKVDQFVHIAGNCDMTAAFVPQRMVQSVTSAFDTETLWVEQQEMREGSPGYNDLEGWSALTNRHPGQADASDTALLFYTSGSTGQPKGVMVSHHGCVLGAASVAHYLELAARDRILALLPLSFDYGFNQLVSTWMVGGCVVLHDFFLAADVVKAVERYGVTGIAAVPPLWHLLMDVDWPRAACSHIRFVTNSGGALSPALQARIKTALPGADVFAMYGLTEAFRSTFMAPIKLAEKPTSMGQAVPFANVFVVDDTGAPAKPGSVGELLHAGPLVAQGYWNDPEQTARRFRPLPDALKPHVDPRYHDRCVYSGDRAFVDEDGDFHFAGRMDDMIKVLGNRLSPQEVEECACLHDDVDHAVAFGIADERLGAKICLVLQGERIDQKTVMTLLRTHLPSFAMPQYILEQQEFARTPNGKVDRQSIRVWAGEKIAQGQGAL